MTIRSHGGLPMKGAMAFLAFLILVSGVGAQSILDIASAQKEVAVDAPPAIPGTDVSRPERAYVSREVTVLPGWNLLPLLSTSYGDRACSSSDLTAVFAYDPWNRKYVRALPASEEWSRLVREHYDYLLHASFWWKSSRKCQMLLAPYPTQNAQILSGWNFVGLYPDMEKHSLADVGAKCDLQNAYWFNTSANNWEPLSLERPVNGDLLGRGIIVSAGRACSLALGDDLPPLPPGPEPPTRPGQVFVKTVDAHTGSPVGQAIAYIFYDETGVASGYTGKDGTVTLNVDRSFFSKPLHAVVKKQGYTSYESHTFFLEGDSYGYKLAVELKPENTPAGDVHTIGNANAPVTIEWFADFQGPYTTQWWNGTWPSIRSNFVDTGKAKLVFRHFPLNFYPNDRPAAIAAECAGLQGNFWGMAKQLLANQNELNTDNYLRWAREMGLNYDQFKSCIYDYSGPAAKRVDVDFAEGTNRGVSGTPSFFINGKSIAGAQPYSVFEQAINEALGGSGNNRGTAISYFNTSNGQAYNGTVHATYCPVTVTTSGGSNTTTALANCFSGTTFNGKIVMELPVGEYLITPSINNAAQVSPTSSGVRVRANETAQTYFTITSNPTTTCPSPSTP